MSTLILAAQETRNAISAACAGLIDREALVELVILCAVTQEHMLIVGPPGTAKSEAVRRIARRIGGRYFEYLVGRFTEPSELFGPVNLRKLKEGIVETETDGMLPEAEVAFIDEIFLGSTAILNTLLTILNERRFRRGHTDMHCPLRVCVGASNHLPEDEQLAAFADRFLVRFFVAAIPDSGLEALLESGWALSKTADKAESPTTMTHVALLGEAARTMDLTPVRPVIAESIRRLRGAGVELSDRRIVRLQHLVAAAAVLDGRTTPSRADLWPIIYALPTQSAQQIGRDVLQDILTASENATLLAAAADGSASPKARGAQVVREGLSLLESIPSEVAHLEAWHLKIESVAREIDATFTGVTIPSDVAALRRRIVEALSIRRRTATQQGER